jgi:hypothetical protein
VDSFPIHWDVTQAPPEMKRSWHYHVSWGENKGLKQQKNRVGMTRSFPTSRLRTVSLLPTYLSYVSQLDPFGTLTMMSQVPTSILCNHTLIIAWLLNSPPSDDICQKMFYIYWFWRSTFQIAMLSAPTVCFKLLVFIGVSSVAIRYVLGGLTCSLVCPSLRGLWVRWVDSRQTVAVDRAF